MAGRQKHSSFGWISAILAGGVAGAIFWQVINELGNNLLQNLAFPLNRWWAGSCIGAVLTLIAELCFSGSRRKRREQLQTFADFNNLRFEESVTPDALGDDRHLQILSHWDEADNYLEGTWNGSPIRLFDFTRVTTTRTSKGSSTNRTTRTVLLMPIDGLPLSALQVLQTGPLAVFAGVSGYQFRSNPDSLISDDERNLIEDFNETYLVATKPDTMTSGEPASLPSDEPDASVTDVLSLPVLRALKGGPGFSFEIRNGMLAVWIRGKKWNTAKLPGLMSAALQLRAVLQQAADSASEKLEIRSDSRADDSIALGQIAPLAVSGCLGMVVSFALFAPVFFLFAGDAPWIVFLWPPFGAAVVGLAIFIGVRVARRRRRRRIRDRDTSTMTNQNPGL